jgi:hypothetical protein
MKAEYPDNPVGWARRAVDQWLVLAPVDREARLVRWLQNYDEAADWGDEPYIWILNSLPPGADGADARKAMAEVIQAVLARRPDVEPLGKHREQLLYNLLQLAAAIYRPNRLWQPLLELLNRRKLAGEFLGSDLRASLRAALIGNQGDGQLAELWLRMGRNQEDYLPGTPVHAYYGALMLPPVDGGPSPVVKESLSLAAADLESDFDRRRPRFMELLQSLTTAFPRDTARWDRDLVFMADEARWPIWTCFCVNMFPRFGDQGDLGMPAPVADTIESCYGIPIERRLWNDCMARMRLRGDALTYYERFRESFEADLHRMQQQTEFRSDGAWQRVLQNTLKASRSWIRPVPRKNLTTFFHRTFRVLNLGFSLANQGPH